jgi:hypothetical protein
VSAQNLSPRRRTSTLTDAKVRYAGAGGVAPPIPAALERYLICFDEWCYATRDIDPQAMYYMDTYLLEAIASPTKNYLALSKWGHGMNSYALNYQLVYDGLVVFLQVGWGGVYMHEEQQAKTLASWFTDAANVLKASEEHRSRHTNETRILVVAQSELTGRNVCGWIRQPLPGLARQWLSFAETKNGPALDAALLLLTS